MTEFIGWSKATLSDVKDGGPNTMYSFICDYQRATKDYGWMSVDEFVKHGQLSDGKILKIYKMVILFMITKAINGNVLNQHI